MLSPRRRLSEKQSAIKTRSHVLPRQSNASYAPQILSSRPEDSPPFAEGTRPTLSSRPQHSPPRAEGTCPTLSSRPEDSPPLAEGTCPTLSSRPQHSLPRAEGTCPTLSSRPQHSLPLAEGNAEWRDLLSRVDDSSRRLALIVLVFAAGLFLATSAHGQSTQTPRSVPPDLTCTPAPCVLPPTQASEGGSIVTDSPIATDPLDENQLLLGSYDANCPGLGFHLSRDGGSSWTLAHCMPVITLGGKLWDPDDEPSVGYDRKGTAYAAGLYFCTGYCYDYTAGLIAVQKSSDGTHWSKPVVALRLPGQTFPYMTRLAVDGSPTSPRLDSIYVSGVMALGRGKTQILVSHSTDGGATWKQAAVDVVQKFPEEDDLTRVAIGKEGTVHVTWMRCSSPCRTAHIMFSKSTDGGNTWSSPTRIAKVTMPLDWALPNTDPSVRVYNYPVTAVDNSNGPNAGNLYVAMYTWTGTYLRVQVIRSTDGGNTWSNPVALAPKTDTHDQFFPAISVSPAGLVGVSWLDRRNDPSDVKYQAFAAFSNDGGKTFQPNWQLTQAFSNPDTNGDYNWMGDYTGNTFAGGNFIAAWMDSSNGVDMQEVVGGVRLH